MTAWLSVVSKEHVMRAVGLGIAQVSHGRRAPLARMKAGDHLVYYSPRERMDAGASLKAFTAVGTFPDDEIWQADEGTFQPFRRRAQYADAADAPLAPLKDTLDLTQSPNWGYQLRRGLLELSEHDFAIIRSALRTS